MTPLESTKQNAEYVKLKAYQHCRNDHFREKVEELADAVLKMMEDPVSIALLKCAQRNESYIEELTTLRQQVEEMKSVLEAVRSQMCWEQDRDQLTMGMADLHDSVTKALEQHAKGEG